MITYLHGPSGTGKTTILQRAKNLSNNMILPMPELYDDFTDDCLDRHTINTIRALSSINVPVIIASKRPPSFSFKKLFPDAVVIRLREAPEYPDSF